MPSSSPPLRVAVIGGGLGGLCLAQGLKRAGDVEVTVYERDRTRTDRLQGYRIHIDPAGSRALHECLPAELYIAFVSTRGMSGGGFGMMTEGLRELIFFEVGERDIEPDPVASHKSVSRITLRQVLLAGLEENVHFDKTFARYERDADGSLVAHFEDGSSATADVLVGADGGNSRVRRQLLPHAQRIDTGVVSVGGKLALTAAVRAIIPPNLFRGPALIAAPKGRSMFLAVQEFAHRPAAADAIGGDDGAAALYPGLLFDNTDDYLMWGFGARRSAYGFVEEPERLDGPALQRAVLRLIDDWHPTLRRLVAEADPTTVSLLPIRTAVPVEPWPASTVTLLGDAIHSMTPYRGIGANVALRDAALLCRRLTAAARGEEQLVAAIAAYEAEMREYGFAAVRDSLRAMEQAVSENGVARTLTRTAFRTINAVPPLKRRVTARFVAA